MKFANPRNDIAFKKIFGDTNHKEILISFLNAILNFKDEEEIKDVEILNPYQVPKIEDLKETILDIKATNKKDKNFIVEMQKKNLHDFAKRSLYYTSKSYVEQIDKGTDYENLQKVYFIGICDFKIFDSKHYISRHLILNKETLKNDLADFEFTFIELPKFKNKLDSLTSIIDKWTYFIKKADKVDYIPTELSEVDEINEAYKIITQHKWSKQESEAESALKTAEMNGVKKGIEQGIEQGKKAEKIEIAKNLLDVLDNETIALKTGLTIQEIEKLRVK